MAADWPRKHMRVVPRSRCSTRLDTPATPSSITVWLTLVSTYCRSPIRFRRLAGRCAKCSNHRRPGWPEEPPQWGRRDELPIDDKADLVDKENRQLHDLLNQLVDRIVALEINIEKIRRTLDHPMVGKPMRAAVGRRKGRDRIECKSRRRGRYSLGHKDDSWSFRHFDTITVSA